MSQIDCGWPTQKCLFKKLSTRINPHYQYTRKIQNSNVPSTFESTISLKIVGAKRRQGCADSLRQGRFRDLLSRLSRVEQRAAARQISSRKGFH